MKISPADPADIPAIEVIVNGAYRGDHSKKGWTSEADLIEGSLRTDRNALLQLLQSPGATILKHTGENGEINGCVYLQLQDRYMELGMLSVNPDVQAAGIGKRLLTAAIDHAKINGKSKIKIKNENGAMRLAACKKKYRLFLRHIPMSFTRRVECIKKDAGGYKKRVPCGHRGRCAFLLKQTLAHEKS